MAGRLIGDAFIAILPETTAFRSQADAQIKRSLGTLNPQVKVGADTSEAQTQIAQLAAEMKAARFDDIDIGINAQGALMDLASLRAATDLLKGQLEDIPMSLDDSAALSKVYGLIAAADQLKADMKNVNADGNFDKLAGKFYGLEAQSKQLQASLSHLDPNMDPDEALAKLAALRVDADSLNARLSDMTIDADDTKALAKFVQIQAALSRLAQQMHSMPMDANTLPVEASLLKIRGQVEDLAEKLGPASLKIDPDDLPAAREMAELIAQADALRASLADMPTPGWSAAGQAELAQLQAIKEQMAEIAAGTSFENAGGSGGFMPAYLQALDAEAKRVTADLAKMPDSVNTAGAVTQFATMGDRIEAVNDYLQRTGEVGTASYEALSGAVKDVNDQFLKLQGIGVGPDQVDAVRTLDSAIRQLGADTGLTVADTDKAAVGFGILGRAIAAIKNTHIDLFGGALTNAPLPNFLTQASGIHMLVEGVVELTAVWGPMLVGLTAFAALAYSTGKDIYTQFTNMNTVVDATGAKFQGLTGGLQKLESAVQPQVMQLFGDYLTVAGNQGDHFQKVMTSIGTVLDDFGAKIAMDLNDQKTSTFLDKASSDLAGVGDAFEQLGRIIHTLLEAVPGYAEMLLKFGDGFLTLVANVTAGMEPAIAWFLKLHGAIFYLGLATTAVMTFGRSFAAAAIAKGAAGLSESFTGMAESANRWAEDFTSDNEKIAEAAGNSGSRLGTWAQGIGGLFGNLVNGGIKVTSTLRDMFQILTGSASVAGLAGGVSGLDNAIKDLGSTGKLTTDGLDALQDALLGLKNAGTDAAGIEVLNNAIASLKDTGESTDAVEALQKVLGGMSGGGGLGADAEDAGEGVGRFSQVVSKLPGFSMDAEKGLAVFGTALTDLPLGPIGLGVGVLAAAIGVGLFLALHHSADAAAQLEASLNKLIAASNLADVQATIASAINQTTEALEKQQKIADDPQAALSAGAVGRQVVGYMQSASEQVGEYTKNLMGLVGTYETVTGRLSGLESAYGGLSGAMEVMNLAGVSQGAITAKGSAAWALNEQKINATAQAYGFMNQAASTSANHLATLTIATGDTTKATQSLVSAEQAWLSLITGGDTAFTSFEQGQTTLAQAMASGSKTGASLSVTIAGVNNKYKLVGTTLNGTSQSALAARAAFDQQVTAAGTLYGNLQSLAAASGNTSKAQGEVAQSGKDMVAQMLPMAAGSKEATAELYALAQVAGYTGTDSFAALAKWAGTAKGAEANLNDQQAKLTLSSANLTQAAKNLGNAIISEVTQMEAAKVSSGSLESAVNGLFNNFKTGKGAVNEASVSLSGEYVNALEKAGSSQSNATQMLNAYLKTLGYTPGQIKEIDAQLGDSTSAWDTYTEAQKANATAAKNLAAATKNNADAFTSLDGILPGSVTQLNDVWASLVKQDQAMVKSGNDSSGAKAQFISFATNGLGVTSQAADTLWEKFGNQNLDTLAAKAGNTKTSFINLAEHGLGLSQEAASTLWGEFAQQNLDMLASKGDNSKNAFIELARNGLDLTTSEANTLWQTLKMQYLDTLAGKAGETESAFAKTASQFGLNSTAADTLWGKLKNLSGGSPYNVNVDEHLSGSGQIKATISAASVTLAGGQGTGAGVQAASSQILHAEGTHSAASGWQVPAGGGPAGKDSVHAMLAPGELVIPTSHAAKFGAQAKAAGIPGFAAGGVVGAATTIGNTAQAGVPTAENAAETFTANAMSTFSTQVSNAFTAKQDAAMGIGGAYGGPSSFGGGFESLSALVSFARYFMANGLNAAAAAGMAATISGEEDSAGPESRNCVPLTYKVVTDRGVLAHDEVKTGDTIPAYDLTKRRVVIAEVLDVPYHYDAEMCRIGNASWSADCTVDHKWITEGRGLVRADRIRMGERILLGNGRAEPMYTFERLDNADTFCLTTTTGTWITVKDDGDEIWTGNSSGWGLIGWTGNTVGLPAGYSGPTGNVAYDLQEQLKGVIGYMNAKGGPGALNMAGSPVAAGEVWSRYEGPASPLSDTRSAVANEIYAELVGTAAAGAKAAVSTAASLASLVPKITLAEGGIVAPDKWSGKNNRMRPHSTGGVINEPVYGVGANSGLPYSFAENGQPEYVANGSQLMANSNTIQPMTNIQGQAVTQQLAQLILLWQQFPQAIGQAVGRTAGSGVHHGYYSAQN